MAGENGNKAFSSSNLKLKMSLAIKVFFLDSGVGKTTVGPTDGADGMSEGTGETTTGWDEWFGQGKIVNFQTWENFILSLDYSLHFSGSMLCLVWRMVLNVVQNVRQET